MFKTSLWRLTGVLSNPSYPNNKGRFVLNQQYHTGESLIESSEWTLFGDWENPFEQKQNGSFRKNFRNNKSANHHLDCDHTTFDNIVFAIEFPKNLYQY